MVMPLTEAIAQSVHRRLGLILDAAAVGMPTETQFRALRKIALDTFGTQSFLPELEALIVQHGQERNGRADTARKEVPR